MGMITIMFLMCVGLMLMIEMTDIKKEKEKRWGKK
jgi:hypothetical protein